MKIMILVNLLLMLKLMILVNVVSFDGSGESNGNADGYGKLLVVLLIGSGK